MMIFLPMTAARARRIRTAGGTEDLLDGWAATPQMITAHGYRPEDDEDAEYAAQLYASVAALDAVAEPGDEVDHRLVVAAEVPAGRISDAGHDRDHGAVRVDGLRWPEVTAVFVDEPAAADAVRSAREAVGTAADLPMEVLVELPAVAVMIDDHDLLWHHPDEQW